MIFQTVHAACDLTVMECFSGICYFGIGSISDIVNVLSTRLIHPSY